MLLLQINYQEMWRIVYEVENGGARELVSILQYHLYICHLYILQASKNNKTSHILAGTYDQSPCLHDLEEQKKVSAFQTFRRKIESESLAKNIKCKGHKEHKL